MINCKAAPRGGSYSSSTVSNKQKNRLLKQLLAAHNATIQQPKKKKKLTRMKLLCRVKTDNGIMHVYSEGYFKFRGQDDDYSMWKLAHSEIGPLFLFSTDDGMSWETEWNSSDADEVRIANTIAQALADLETEKMLKGEYDETTTQTGDSP